MSFLQRTLLDPFAADCDALRRARYGVIEMRHGRLAAIHLRRLPKVIWALEIEWLGNRRHERAAGNCCRVYYNQPRRFPNYLVLKYVVSDRDCTLATIGRGLQVLDELARVKRSDALLCDVWNSRISDRMLARCGWQPHKPARWHRHFIKRFYGEYPPPRPDVCRVSKPDAGVLAQA